MGRCIAAVVDDENIEEISFISHAKAADVQGLTMKIVFLTFGSMYSRFLNACCPFFVPSFLH